jgi:hypothetical protein
VIVTLKVTGVESFLYFVIVVEGINELMLMKELELGRIGTQDLKEALNASLDPQVVCLV